MQFSIATLLTSLSEDKLVAAKALEKKLGCDDEESLQKLQIALDALERIGVIVKERGKYRRVREENLVEAKLRCSSKGFCFAIQDTEEADDIYIRESHLSNAWNGDRVLVKIIKEGTRRRSPEGEVKVILERANPSLLAQIRENNGSYRAIPLDDRLLFELELKENGENLSQAVEHLVHVAVVRHPIGENLPLGQVTRILGSDAEAAADTDIVSCKHDLPQTFPPEALEEAVAIRALDYNDPEIQQRLDFRDTLTFTLEEKPFDEQRLWIENAFSLEKNKAGQWRLGVHIADVAHGIAPDTLLDKLAKKRSTAIYLGEKLLPLFPEMVSEKLSLLANCDRLAVSIFLHIDDKGEVQEFEISQSLIHVDYHLTYQEAQNLLNYPPEDPSEQALAQLLKDLFFNLCPLVKAQRIQRGSFEIQLDKLSPFKDEGRAGVIINSPAFPICSLLSNVLILVGKAVASHLLALEIPGFYCGQPDPDWEELEDLIKLSQNLGLEINLLKEDEVTSQDYQNLTQAFSNSAHAKILNYMLYGTLKPVKYSSHPIPHFGLAYRESYTHCLSPGKRYGDLVIQRILKTLLQEGRDRRHKLTKTGVNLASSSCHGHINWNVLPPQTQEALEEECHALVPYLNERAKIAEDAERDLDGLKKAEKMKERTGQVFRGLITGVQSYGFFVEIEDLLVEGLVHVSSLKDDWYEHRPRHSCLVGRKNRTAYRLGDEVEVEVKNVDYYRQQIDLITVGGGSSLRNEDFEED
jgi:ribonuclease R